MSDARAAFKRQAAERAVELIEPGMVVGLGGGTTAHFALQALALLLRTGALHDVLGVACTGEVEAEARRLGIPLATLDDHPTIDLTIDGADEVDPQLRLIKGGGGALLREKIVAQASRREVIVIDESKLSPRLGTRHALPVEVVPFGWTTQRAFLEGLGGRVELRLLADGRAFRTDQGNLILDCAFGPLEHPDELAARLAGRAGIAEHGLFIGLATDLIVAGPDGVELHRRAGLARTSALTAIEARAADGDR
ncbi:MAG: ribose-5-phosphate isomerase RpiA [Candidatus Limnocylindrales bacterium]